MTDCDMENTETKVWLESSYRCGYINEEVYLEKKMKCDEVGKLLQDIKETRRSMQCLRSEVD